MTVLLLLVLAAFLCEVIDSSVGMGYGTILSPALILCGYEPGVVVPAILITQAIGGLLAALFHHHYHNMDLRGGSRDFWIAILVSGLGILASAVAALVSLSLPKEVVTTYIGILITLMGVFLLTGKKYQFSWGKMVLVAVLSAFNKSISGGGFGPVVTAGQVVSGQGARNAIGVTTFAEAPICVVGFAVYLFSGSVDWTIIGALGIGAALAAPCGPYLTRMMNSPKVIPILGLLIAILGVLTLVLKVKL